MANQQQRLTTKTSSSCASSKSFVFLALMFISLFSLHAVAKIAVDGYAEEPVADEVQTEPEPAVTPQPEPQPDGKANGDFRPVKPVYATLESEEDDKTLWNPISRAWLTDEQVELLKLAYDIGYKDGGVRHARTLQAIMLQETHAGLMGRIGHLSAPVGKRSYGVMQVKVSAAGDVLKRNPEFGEFKSAEELIAKLLTDDEFNIRVASQHVLYLRKFTRSDAQTLMAYNIGLNGSRRYDDHTGFKYVKGVNRFFAKVVLPFNRKYRPGPTSPSRA